MASVPLIWNVIAFLVAAAVVWVAGAWLVRLANAISDKTGLAQAFAGMLVLGTITTQPEISATITSAATGNAPLAVNNLVGSLSFNLLILVLGDALIRRGPLTAAIVGPSIMLQGVLGMIAMGIVAMAIAVTTGQTIAGVGFGTVIVFGFAIGSFRLVSRYDRRAPWRTDRSVDADEFTRRYGVPSSGRSRLEEWSLAQLIGAILLLAAIVFVSGVALSRTADAIAQQTGLGSGLTGLFILGIATSLPEISTVTHAVRMRRFELAIGEILGANIFNLAVLFLADLAYPGPAILSAVGGFESAAILLPLILTGILMVGLLEQRNRHFLGLGIDSWAIVIVYFGGVALLYSLA